MTIELPCEVGDKFYLDCAGRRQEATVTGLKVYVSNTGFRTKVFVSGAFGRRSYNADHIGAKLFKK